MSHEQNPNFELNRYHLDMGLVHKEAEMNVLGSYIKVPSLIGESSLLPSSFYFPEHRRIMKALLALTEKNYPVDVVSIVEEVGFPNLHEIGGQQNLGRILEHLLTTENVRYHEKLVLEYANKRRAIEISDAIRESVITGGEGMNLADALQRHASDLMNIEMNEEDEDDGSIEDALVELYDEFETSTGEITGTPTGYTDFDRMTSGLQDGDLFIVGARPSVGKTAFALNIARGAMQDNFYKDANNLKQGAICGIFSLEMPKKQLLKRLISQEGNIDSVKLRSPLTMFNDKDWGNLTMAYGLLHKYGLRIFDKPAVTVSYIWKKVRKLRKDFPDRKIIILIDYLQLILGSPDSRGNRQQEVSEISRSLKLMAREFSVNVIALSQLSRGVEQRQDKRPMMSDLRESGAIEQDADVIGFLYRDDYYDKESEDKNIIEIIIAKQRNGPVGTVKLAFVKEYGKFVNLELRHNDTPIHEGA